LHDAPFRLLAWWRADDHAWYARRRFARREFGHARATHLVAGDSTKQTHDWIGPHGLIHIIHGGHVGWREVLAAFRHVNTAVEGREQTLGAILWIELAHLLSDVP